MQSSEMSETIETRVEAVLLPETETQPAYDKNLLLVRLHRRFLDTYHHRPRRLFVAVNGIIVASLDIASRKNELRVSTSLPEPLKLVEIFSEQNVRLALVNNDPALTEVLGRKANISLSDGRRLRLSFKEGAAGLSIHLSYRDPDVEVGRFWKRLGCTAPSQWSERNVTLQPQVANLSSTSWTPTHSFAENSLRWTLRLGCCLGCTNRSQHDRIHVHKDPLVLTVGLPKRSEVT